MSKVAGKCRRTSTEQSWPRGAAGRRKDIFASGSPSSSSSQSPSPPRRRDVVKSMVLNAIRPRTSAVPNYRGVRYREELSKYVSEIRPTKCSKKIWLGTYDTAEEAARAFDIGNLCCQKNLPLNFSDSPTMLKRISSQLSPEEARSAIAKLAKEVARLEVSKRENEVDHMPMPHHELVQPQAFQPEIAQIQRFASTEIPSNVYTEQLQENVECAMQVATPSPIGGGGGGGPGNRSWSFHLSDVILDDDLTDIPLLNFGDQDHNFGDQDHNFGDAPSFDQDNDRNYGDVIYYSHDYGF